MRQRRPPSDIQSQRSKPVHEEDEEWRGPSHLQGRWLNLPASLFPQINRSQIEWIAIGDILGTGISLGTLSTLKVGGPAGMFLAYVLTSFILFFVLHSIGELVTFRPNAAGAVGLPAEFVDEALGFAMGFNAYYNWTFIIPYQIYSAALLMTSLFPSKWDEWTTNVLLLCLTAFFFLSSFAINCFGMHIFGRIQKIMTLVKIWGYICLIITCFVISLLPVSTSLATPNLQTVKDPYPCGNLFGLPNNTITLVFETFQNASGPSTSPDFAQIQFDTIHSLHPDATVQLGMKYWTCPGPFVEYRNINGSKGHFLGTWQGLLQASFSFLGAEVPGSATEELKNPEKIILPAIMTVWWEISLLYIFAVFAIGLVVPSNYTPPIISGANGAGLTFANTSPFIAAINTAQFKFVPNLIVILFAQSAWSAGVSSIYSSSRLLFLVSKRGYAPRYFQISYYYPGPIAGSDPPRVVTDQSQHDSEPSPASANEEGAIFVPWVAVLVSALASTISFWVNTRAKVAFDWLTLMTTCAAILHWVAILVTYVIWYQATRNAERGVAKKQDGASAEQKNQSLLASPRLVDLPQLADLPQPVDLVDLRQSADLPQPADLPQLVDLPQPADLPQSNQPQPENEPLGMQPQPAEENDETRESFRTRNYEDLYRHRPRYQPIGAYFALGMSILILVFNGWAVFAVPRGWLMAETTDVRLVQEDPILGGALLPTFITSYLPLPIFLLCIFGYKLIAQSQRVELDEDRLATAVKVSVPDTDIHWTMRVVQFWRFMTRNRFSKSKTTR